eukprot:scaffold84685_cov33-Tisochrysis_lutea.AAC.1
MLARSARLLVRRLSAGRVVGVAGVVASLGAWSITHAEARTTDARKQTVLDHAPQPPPKLDDPEYNAQVLETWRDCVRNARLAWQRHDHVTAEAELQTALEIASHFGSSSAPMATSLLNLAQLYRRTSRQRDAEPLLSRAADILDQTAGPYTKVTIVALVDLARTKLELGDLQSAAAGFEDVLERMEQAEQHRESGFQALLPMRPAVLILAAQSHEKLGKSEQAEARLLLATGYIAERWGPDSPRLIAPYSALTRILSAQGDRETETADLEERVATLQRLQQASKIDGKLSTLHEKLVNGESVLYGSGECGDTRRQLAEIGGLEGAFRYVDCNVSDVARAACEAQGVGSFPTWLINGRRFNGFMSRAELEEACDHVSGV